MSANGVHSLKKFSVSADSQGPIGLWKFTFGVSTTSVNVADGGVGELYLYESDSSSTLGDLVANGADFVFTHVDGTDADIIEAYFDDGDDDAAGSAETLIVSAGDTKYYTLRADVSAVGGSNEAVIASES